MNRPPHATMLLGLSFLLLAACGGGGVGSEGIVGGVEQERFGLSSLDQAAYRSGTTRYEYGHDSIRNIPIEGAPTDADASRWAMLHDGSTYRLYAFRRGTSDLIYQFGFDGRSYTFGHDSIPEIPVTGGPPTRDPSSFAMLHDGRDYRLYMRDLNDPALIHQWAFNASTGRYEYGFRSIATIRTTGLPADADLGRWGMLHDGITYRQYVGQQGSDDTIYQFGFDGRSYAFGHDSIPVLTIQGMPSDSVRSSFAMLHDGSAYRFYHQAP